MPSAQLGLHSPSLSSMSCAVVVVALLYVVKTLHLVFRQVLRRSLVEVSGANEITPSGEENTSPDGVMVMARLAVSFGKLRYRSQRHEDAKRRRSHALPDWLSPRRS
jgi:hypothetical protein